MKELPNPTFALSPFALPRLSRLSRPSLHQGGRIVHPPLALVRSVSAEASREARIYSAWRAITCIGRSAALVFLQISRYLLQKPPCIPSRFPSAAHPRE